MKLYTDIGQKVAQEMQQIMTSPDHQALFIKQAKTCCDKDCTCDGKKCSVDCQCKKEIAKEASFSEITQLLIEASEIFDQHDMPKVSLATMAMVDSLMHEHDVTKIDDTHDDTNEIRVKDVFGPHSHEPKEYVEVSPEPFDMEKSLEEFENDPDLEKINKLLSNREILKELDQKRLDEIQEAKLQQWLDEQEDSESFLDLNDARVLSNLGLPELEDSGLEEMYSPTLRDSEKDLIDLLEDLEPDTERFSEENEPLTLTDPIRPSSFPTLPSAEATIKDLENLIKKAEEDIDFEDEDDDEENI